MARLSTHVLDLASGKPAAGLAIELFRWQSGIRYPIKNETTNADGRTNEPLIAADSIETGEYELVFSVARYFRAAGVALPTPPFLDQVVIRFGISDALGNYHVPLLVSPYGYSTYRGS